MGRNRTRLDREGFRLSVDELERRRARRYRLLGLLVPNALALLALAVSAAALAVSMSRP